MPHFFWKRFLWGRGLLCLCVVCSCCPPPPPGFLRLAGKWLVVVRYAYCVQYLRRVFFFGGRCLLVGARLFSVVFFGGGNNRMAEANVLRPSPSKREPPQCDKRTSRLTFRLRAEASSPAAIPSRRTFSFNRMYKEDETLDNRRRELKSTQRERSTRCCCLFCYTFFCFSHVSLARRLFCHYMQILCSRPASSCRVHIRTYT